jgi:hypothetical protein
MGGGDLQAPPTVPWTMHEPFEPATPGVALTQLEPATHGEPSSTVHVWPTAIGITQENEVHTRPASHTGADVRHAPAGAPSATHV